ncbi:MAG: cyanophycinase [Candidatus Sericytochromatia bacterium]|nr:cyanophycinase [Candidatus Sericytochromatia bacterium]
MNYAYRSSIPRTLIGRGVVVLLALGTIGCQQAIGASRLGPAAVRTANAGADQTNGPIMVIGGGKDQDLIMQTFITLSGGKAAPLVVVTLASDDPAKSGQAYVDYLKQLGCTNARFILPSTSGTAPDQQAFAAGRGFFFSGGDQRRILSNLTGTWQTAIKSAWQHGATIAGTSAGAMVWGRTAILGGDPQQTAWYGEDPTHDGIRLGSGFGFLPGTVVDTHFSERGRLPRLAFATAKDAGGLGIGVDPQTAAIIRPSGSLTVTGNGTVTVVQVPAQPIKLPMSLKNMTVSVLSAGDEWANGIKTKAAAIR